jgi:hypothetical protein
MIATAQMNAGLLATNPTAMKVMSVIWVKRCALRSNVGGVMATSFI